MTVAQLLRRAAVAAGCCLVFAAQAPQAATAWLPACRAGSPAAIVVRIGQTPPRQAWLRGGAAPALQIIDAETSQPLWSAAATQPASQLFNAMHAQFAGSLLPLDLDGDGVHDRIYAGDLAGRLWRFDLHHGLPAAQWATGGVFADFSSGSRGFLAAPDVSLSETDFRITLGTARMGTAAVDNRLYVLRDSHPYESWSQEQYERWRPLREADLVQLHRLGSTLTGPAPNGYFIAIGGFDILSPTLTASGRATLALADPGSASDSRCVVSVVVSSIDLADGRVLRTAAVDGDPPPRLTLPLPADARFELRRESDRALCTLGDTRIPACDVDLSPRRLWWRREDAD